MQSQTLHYPAHSLSACPSFAANCIDWPENTKRNFIIHSKDAIIREDKKDYDIKSIPSDMDAENDDANPNEESLQTSLEELIPSAAREIAEETSSRIDHDRLFKELFQNFFAEFIQLFFPQIHEHIDYTQLHFLSQEIFTDVTTGEKREIDILAEAKLKDEQIAFLIHVENQSYRQKEFAERMFVYFSRLYEKHRIRILPIAVFNLDDKREESDQFTMEFPFHDVFQFKFLKVELRKINWRAYIRQDNPVAAALLSTMGYTESEKVQVKKEFLRMLVRLELNPAHMQLIGGFFDTYLQLNEKEEMQLKEEIKQLDREEAEAVFRIEPAAMRKGRLEGKIEMIRGMLNEGIDVATIARIANIPAEEIEKMKEKL